MDVHRVMSYEIGKNMYNLATPRQKLHTLFKFNRFVFQGFPDLAEVGDSFAGGKSQNLAVKRELDRTIKSKSLDNKAYLQQFVVPTLLKGLSEMYEVRPKSPIEWLADWLEENNPNRE